MPNHQVKCSGKPHREYHHHCQYLLGIMPGAVNDTGNDAGDNNDSFIQVLPVLFYLIVIGTVSTTCGSGTSGL